MKVSEAALIDSKEQLKFLAQLQFMLRIPNIARSSVNIHAARVAPEPIQKHSSLKFKQKDLSKSDNAC